MSRTGTRYAAWKAAGRCTDCGREPAPNRSLCQRDLDRRAEMMSCRKARTVSTGPYSQHNKDSGRVTVKGTGRYDSQYQPTDLPAHVIDAIFLREQRKKRPAWSLCR